MPNITSQAHTSGHALGRTPTVYDRYNWLERQRRLRRRLRQHEQSVPAAPATTPTYVQPVPARQFASIALSPPASSRTQHSCSHTLRLAPRSGHKTVLHSVTFFRSSQHRTGLDEIQLQELPKQRLFPIPWTIGFFSANQLLFFVFLRYLFVFLSRVSD